ncbi:hypothetical protein LX73_0619 [Fodinibius salinus]|uniref:Uncharacterized protein n=1 Tax=Fodinibius salinus TaxID=860790 RepID=A0A5D3YS09_9BACT|nr:hypothetical protein [Fodinibius salinus]TYP95321.1 hypothetical protein LX73_0619 [Fodinibius salinus]
MIYIELLIYVLLILLLLSNDKVKTLISNTKILTKTAGLIAVAGMIFAQLYNTPDYTYPFVQWDMYSGSYPAPAYLEYRIELTNDNNRHYPIDEVAFTSQKGFMVKLEDLMGGAKKQNNALTQTVEALINIYEYNHPDDTVKQFMIISKRVQPSQAKEDFSVEATKIFEYQGN